MTESEAWEWLAKKWDGPLVDGRDIYVDADGWHALGLCPCIEGLKNISAETRRSMLERLNKEKRLPNSRFVWPPTIEGAAQRAAFCRQASVEARTPTTQTGE